MIHFHAPAPMFLRARCNWLAVDNNIRTGMSHMIGMGRFKNLMGPLTPFPTPSALNSNQNSCGNFSLNSPKNTPNHALWILSGTTHFQGLSSTEKCYSNFTELSEPVNSGVPSTTRDCTNIKRSSFILTYSKSKIYLKFNTIHSILTASWKVVLVSSN